jgi:hypothetical protein
MEVGYGVRWRDTIGEVEGRLVVGPESLRLMPMRGERAPLREVPFEAIGGLELSGAEGSNDRPILVFHLPTNESIEVESSVGKWILGDLLKETLLGILVEAPVQHRVLVSVRTEPGSRERVAELLKEGPPFDPFATSITRHDVFVLDDQVLFLFETDDRLEGADSFADAWRWAEPWRDLVLEARDAEQVFSWTRPDGAGARSPAHLGLGY